MIIFAKAPIPGQVKTRLCPPLTPDEAASLHGSFVLDTLERAKAAITKFRLPMDRFLACAPSVSHAFFKIMEERHSVSLFDQVGADLGARMNQAIATVLTQGYRQAIIVGTDVPSLSLTHYQQACSLLRENDLVLGPSTDGGYYLIGLKRLQPELFADIPWSTNRVCALTREKADGLGLKTALLSEWRDIDSIDDLQALMAETGMMPENPRLTRRPPASTAPGPFPIGRSQPSLSPRTLGALRLIANRLRTRQA